MSDSLMAETTQSHFTKGFHALGEADDVNVLRDNLYNFYIAVEQSPAATAITDVDGHIVFVNQQFMNVTGFSRDELIGKTPAMIKSGHTPDHIYKRMWQALKSGQVWKGELQNRKKNGKLYWEREIITPVKDAEGNIVNFIAVKEDITESKRQESELRLLATAFETGQSTVITDADMRIEKVNRAFTEITGYTADEVIGQTPRLFKSGRHDRAFYVAMWDSLLTKGHWQGEVWNRNKYGTIYPLWQSITAVYDENGQIRNFVAVSHNIAERKRIERELEKQATLDHLTGVANRRAFDVAITHAIEEAEQQEGVFSLLIFDIDHFKRINDTHGHDAGDAVLKQLAKLIGHSLRQSDLLSRWGGEEFTILLPTAPLEGALIFAERVRERVEKANLDNLKITISIGVTQYRPGDDSESMILRADDALYQAKRNGRNQVMFKMQDKPPAEPATAHSQRRNPLL